MCACAGSAASDIAQRPVAESWGTPLLKVLHDSARALAKPHRHTNICFVIYFGGRSKLEDTLETAIWKCGFNLDLGVYVFWANPFWHPIQWPCWPRFSPHPLLLASIKSATDCHLSIQRCKRDVQGSQGCPGTSRIRKQKNGNGSSFSGALDASDCRV